MRQINLKEYESSEYRLTTDQLDALLRESKTLDLTIEPVRGARGRYRLKPGSTVGALEVDGASVFIKPKIEMSQLLSLACYAMSKLGFRKEMFDFKEDETLPDILALALSQAARRAFSRGLLRGYLTEEDALYTVRGRIRFDAQIRRRYGIPLPVELRFDEFTEDILANRMVKAAAARLGRMSLRSSEARRGLGRIAAILENVSPVEFRRRNVPEVRFDRLNEHYRHVVGLARLILLHSEFEARHGDVRANGFLVDMNYLFQEFVTQALQEQLAGSGITLRAEKGAWFDDDKRAWLKPDFSCWEDSDTCFFVGDAKYKDLTGTSAEKADLYQLLAYASALNLPGGLLIYAQGEDEAATYKIQNTCKQLEVVALDLTGTLEKVLKRVRKIARKIECMKERCPSASA
ncbi:MAG: hypothetical protein OXJ55_08590 [Caldilineaceae bacterium]|nr:hypothetical protein [Caldilineaceae bacterium]MDE0464268.1 hypothetical protein [Caldilineaceae bacterium]